ncbi:MAG: alpha/beta hydrolase [Mycobacteriales bacterium]
MPLVEREDQAAIWWDATGPDAAPAVVLIMGLAYPSDMWFRLVPELAKEHRVVVLDNRGAGRTGDVVGAPYSVELMAADVAAVLDAAAVDRADVVGASMGGLIAQELALTWPQRVRSLVLACTHPGIAHAVMNPDALAMLSNRGAMTAEQAAEASIPFNYAPSTPRSRIEQDWAVRLPLATTPTGYLAQAQGTMVWNGLPRIERLQVPTLVLHGELDRLVPVENGRLLAAHIPGAELVTIPAANHLFFSDQPEKTAEILTDWLDRPR